MCGVAGIYSTKCRIHKTRNLVEETIESPYRRGPDHQAIDAKAGERANLVVGANRLSIIDLSPEANQPMWDNERRYCLVFNGEIYNYVELRKELVALGHSFSTRSDSDVILESFKEWGVRAAERFNGMFAFALSDNGEECLYLFRHRFGVKPLYYFVDHNKLYFASTCRVIARHLRLEPNLGARTQFIKAAVGSRALKKRIHAKGGANPPDAHWPAPQREHIRRVSRRF